MISYLRAIKACFETIRIVMSGGGLLSSNPEVRRMTRDLYNIDVPSVREDRKNLKKDADSVIGDYRKAYEHKKFELQH